MRMTAPRQTAILVFGPMLLAAAIACNSSGGGSQQPTPTLYVIPTQPPTSVPEPDGDDSQDDLVIATVTPLPTETLAPTLDIPTPTPLSGVDAPPEGQDNAEIEATAAAIEALLDNLFNMNQDADSLESIDDDLTP